MEVGFDKEIDAMLRTARANEAATSLDSHLDADEISAFAENALPESLRQQYTAHFADCNRCRKILSNTISLNSEAKTEAASSVVPAKIVEAEMPWYRKFFVFPQITYAMGALVVLFSGFFGYLLLQNQSSKNAEVSYSVDKSQEMPKPTAVSNANTSVFSTANTSSNVVITNSTTIANTITNSASLAQSNANVSATPAERKTNEPTLSKSAPVQPTTAPEAKPSDNESLQIEKDLAKSQTENEINKPNAAGAIRDDRKIDEKKVENLPLNGRNMKDYQVDGQSADSVMTQPAPKTSRSATLSLKKKESEAGAARSIGGKTFNNVGGIWFDSAYTKQKQKTYKRGTSDYLRLDADLRSIADQFSGTVVILWNGKAYRIQ